jgi:hypothetical protein
LGKTPPQRPCQELFSEKIAVSYETGQVITDYSHGKRMCFNEYGLLTELREVSTHGIAISNFLYRYDEKQRLTEAVFVNPDGSYGLRYVKKYDDQDRLTEEKRISETGSADETIVHTYSEEGFHASKRYDDSGKCRSFILQWRNPETNIIESHWYNEQDKLEEISWNNPLDDHGSLECLTFDGWRNFKRKSVFIEDAYGHRIVYHEESASPCRSAHSFLLQK